MQSLADRAPTSRPRVIVVDFETSSAADLKACGAWQYSRHPSTTVLCAVFGVATTAGRTIDTEAWWPGEPLPDVILDELAAGTPLLAWNCAFERAIWRHVLAPRHAWPHVKPEAWLDAQPLALAIGLPPTLEGAAAALGCAVQKDMEGAALMRRMATTVDDGEGGWLVPELTPANRKRLVEYCRADVLATADAWFRLPMLSTVEHLVWRLDQKVNQRGVWLDQRFAAAIRTLALRRQDLLTDAAFGASCGELANSTSSPALKAWLKAAGVVLPKLARKRDDGRFEATETAGRAAIVKLLERDDLPADVRQVLELRTEANKATSLAKLARVPVMADERDGRLRDALHFCGAHTGRWTSSGLQVHNLPKVKLSPATAACVVAAIDAGSSAALDVIDTADDPKTPGGRAPGLRPLEALSQSLRSVFAAAPGREFIGADFSAIEARVCAWLAGQEDIPAFFRTYDAARARGEKPQDLYQFTAAKIGSAERQLGKVAALALQYGMGDLTFATTAAGWGVPLTPLQARRVKKAWRLANPGIVGWWAELERAFLFAIDAPGELHWAGLVAFRGDGRCVRMVLPSGRCLHYWRPRCVVTTKRLQVVDDAGVISTKEVEAETLQFWTTGKDKRSMAREDTYGGKLAENATQAVARDLLAEALLRLEAGGYPIVLHVHDSALAEVPAGTGDVAEFCALMSASPSWAADLPVAADGYRDRRFRG